MKKVLYRNEEEIKKAKLIATYTVEALVKLQVKLSKFINQDKVDYKVVLDLLKQNLSNKKKEDVNKIFLMKHEDNVNEQIKNMPSLVKEKVLDLFVSKEDIEDVEELFNLMEKCRVTIRPIGHIVGLEDLNDEVNFNFVLKPKKAITHFHSTFAKNDKQIRLLEGLEKIKAIHTQMILSGLISDKAYSNHILNYLQDHMFNIDYHRITQTFANEK